MERIDLAQRVSKRHISNQFEEVENETVRPSISQVFEEQQAFEIFDIYDKGPFDKKKHLEMRLALQKGQKKIVETSFNRIAQNFYNRAHNKKFLEKLNIPVDVDRRKYIN